MHNPLDNIAERKVARKSLSSFVWLKRQCDLIKLSQRANHAALYTYVLTRTRWELSIRMPHWPELDSCSAAAMELPVAGSALAAGTQIADLIAVG
jgi:hypothetical protein